MMILASLQRAGMFAVVWWLLAAGRADSLAIGVPVVAVATWSSMKLSGRMPWSLPALLRLLPFFFWHSLLGGVDVARRAFSPDLPLRPNLVNYEHRLSPGAPTVLLANMISLLPGTLNVETRPGRLLIHVLDDSGAYRAEIEAVEWRVAAVFRAGRRRG